MKKSILALIVANMIPLIGALSFDWSLDSIILSYWGEGVIIGVFIIAKIYKSEDTLNKRLSVIGKSRFFHTKGSIVQLFLYRYIFAMVIYFVFLLKMFSIEKLSWNAFGISLGVLFLSHLLSYKINFVYNQEYRYMALEDILKAAYKRVFVLHFFVIIGAILIAEFQSVFLGLIFFIMVKTCVDAYSHFREHRKSQYMGVKAI